MKQLTQRETLIAVVADARARQLWARAREIADAKTKGAEPEAFGASWAFGVIAEEYGYLASQVPAEVAEQLVRKGSETSRTWARVYAENGFVTRADAAERGEAEPDLARRCDEPIGGRP